MLGLLQSKLRLACKRQWDSIMLLQLGGQWRDRRIRSPSSTSSLTVLYPDPKPWLTSKRTSTSSRSARAAEPASCVAAAPRNMVGVSGDDAGVGTHPAAGPGPRDGVIVGDCGVHVGQDVTIGRQLMFLHDRLD